MELVAVGFSVHKALMCSWASSWKMRLLEITLIRKILGLEAPV